jgi:hypothetical protein
MGKVPRGDESRSRFIRNAASNVKTNPGKVAGTLRVMKDHHGGA